MRKKRIMKRIATCIIMMSVALSTMTAGVNVYAADTVTPGNMINVKVEGDNLSDTKMKLTDASGNVVASWEKVKSNVVYSDATNKPDESGFDYNVYDAFEFGASDDVISVSYKNSSTSWNKMNGTSLKLKYNMSYELKANLVKKEDTMVVSAGKQIICIDDEWAKKAVEVEMWFPGYEYSNISLNDNAGKQLVYAASGKLNCAYERITGGIMYLDNAEKDVVYDKVTINLKEAFTSPDCFNEKGQYVTDEYGTVDFAKEDTATPIYGVMAIASGSVLNIVIPDENGCVEAYISREENRADINLNFRYGNVMVDASPVLMRVDRGYNVTKTITSVELPYSGVNVVNLKAGNYRLVEMSSAGETLASKTISVANSNEIQKFTYTVVGEVDTDNTGENATQKETEGQTPESEAYGGETEQGTSEEASTDNGTTDSGTTDSGAADNGAADNGTTDNGTTDSGATDGGATDSGATDSGTTDNGTNDNGKTETDASADDGETIGEQESKAATESSSSHATGDGDGESKNGKNLWWLWLLLLIIAGGVGSWLGYRKYRQNNDKKAGDSQ